MIVEDTIQGSLTRSFIQVQPVRLLNILVACKEPKAPGGLEHAGAHRIIYSSIPGWGAAANALLDRAATIGGDALFLDDDVTLTEGCLDGVRDHYDRASLFGLDLHDLTGSRQAGARHILDNEGGLHDWEAPGPAYVAHVSTSAIYLKEDFIQSGIRFPVWPGVHWEDVAFCLDAWLNGFKVLAVPGYVHHAIVGGVGATKRHTPEFWERWAANRQAFGAWCGEQGVQAALARGVIPIGAQAGEEIPV
jgi:hypothetical protein